MQSGYNPYQQGQPQGGQPQSGGFGQQPQQPQHPQAPQQHPQSYGQTPQGGAVPDFTAPQYNQAGGVSGFSFNEADREKMARAGKGAKAMGILMLVMAGLNLLGTNIVAAATNGLIGMFFLQGGTPLARLEEQPNGDDIANVMEGFENLSNMFLTRIILLCIGLGLMLLVFIGIFAMIGAVGFEEFIEELT